MSITRFFTQALGAALELGIATPDDLLKHMTPVLLAQHLPRPLWARLLTACLGAERTDAALVIDTLGVANLCEHLPAPVLWACLSEVAERAVGRTLLVAPPPPGTSAAGSIGAAVIGAAPLGSTPATPPGRRPGDAAEPAHAGSTSRARRNSRQPFRSVGSSPGGRAAAPAPTAPNRPAQPGAASASPASGAAAIAARRPQAAAGRASTALDFDIDTDVRSDWKGKEGEVAAEVDDDQLVDWSANEETVTAGPEFDRKR